MSIESQINYSHLSLSEIAENLSRFADRECKDIAPLYFLLCNHISLDEELLKIAAKVRIGQPIPNLFLSAVHYLLIKSPEENLAQFYPTITGISSDEIPFDLFKSFVLENETKILEIIQTRIVQTNVINRCSYLMPIFSQIIHSEKKHATIIDIGSSAGLTMNWDLYNYKYSEFNLNINSEIQVYTEIRNNNLPKTFFPIHQQISKIGIDQNPIDLSDENEKLWLKALVWTDHLERFQIMDSALKLASRQKNKIFKASTISEFNEIISQVPPEHTLIIYSTVTFYQFLKELIADFWTMLDRIGNSRDLYFVSAEGLNAYQEKYNTKDMVVELTHYQNGEKSQKLVCTTNGHGNWIDWK